MTAPDSRSAGNPNPPAETGLLARVALALTEAVLQIHSEGPFQRKFVESKKEEL